MTGGDSQDPTADWADDVVEGATAKASRPAAGSDARQKANDVDEDGHDAQLSSAVPDKEDIAPKRSKKRRKKKTASKVEADEADVVDASDAVEVDSDDAVEVDVVDASDAVEVDSDDAVEVDEADVVDASDDAVEVDDADVVEVEAQLAAEVSDVSVEGLIADLERVTEEKNQYLDTSRRLQADFENYRKRVAKDTSDARARGKESVISEVLNVLDACDGAVANGSADVEPIRGALLAALGNQGMERIDPLDEVFDPEMHQAVMHDEASDGEGPTVAEVMRAGYKLGGRVIRPAMVRVRG